MIEIKHYQSKNINNLKNSATWKIELMIVMKIMSSKDNNESF